MAQIGSIPAVWMLRVANFEFNFIRQFHQFSKFLCSSCCKFPEFSDTPPNILNLYGFEGCYGQNPPKNRNQKIRQFEPTLKSSLFWKWDFSTFFFNHTSQKYQNEKSPVLNGKKMSKISEKVPKIRDLEGPTAFRPFENTRYIYIYFNFQNPSLGISLHQNAAPLTVTVTFYIIVILKIIINGDILSFFLWPM